jgi:hypothetical protein
MERQYNLNNGGNGRMFGQFVRRSDIFNTLFHYPRVLAPNCQCPSAKAQERYLTHCTDQEVARGTLLRTSRELSVIALPLDIDDL